MAARGEGAGKADHWRHIPASVPESEEEAAHRSSVPVNAMTVVLIASSVSRRLSLCSRRRTFQVRTSVAAISITVFRFRTGPAEDESHPEKTRSTHAR